MFEMRQRSCTILELQIGDFRNRGSFYLVVGFVSVMWLESSMTSFLVLHQHLKLCPFVLKQSSIAVATITEPRIELFHCCPV